MIICVTQKDIDRGEPMSGHCCPVALALSRRFPKKRISVDSTQCYIGYKIYPLSENVRKKIDNFDLGVLIKPFRFNLPCD